ncbi:MAG: hypothetical protein A2086_05785 [Spirochaetes bacterium GWD1_27_9]|nr:MAG: hypothetical protein A2Z98_04645 [Spirochaetes bacterium GWB1_27_13]OHD35288.1 MAG: hypothetical protein A2086_05785 [Spirochaetes bacterium GWD1_27_9]
MLESKKIFIVEDHPIVIKGLSQVINKQSDLILSGYATNANDALTKLEELKPDLVTVDILLKDSNGMELIKNMIYRDPNVKILVISMFDEEIYAERVIKAGAKGYIMKQSLTKQLLKAIYTVLSGKIYLSENLSIDLINKKIKGNTNGNDEYSLIQSLSDRELEVFQLIGDGLTTLQIAEKTNLGVKTVETYKNRIKEKLNLENANLLIKKAVEWQLVNKTM